MKLIDLNADGGIGANSLYVQIGDFHLVVDSGLHPKKVGRIAAPNLRPLEGVRLDLIIITHCHLDHIGSLPLLMRAQPDVPVIMTMPSHMLIERMRGKRRSRLPAVHPRRNRPRGAAHVPVGLQQPQEVLRREG
jgi:predicted metal-dependent RNase